MMTRTAFALLESIGASEATFHAVGAEVEKAALTIMQKLLKAKDLTLAGVRDVRVAIGNDTFSSVMDNLPDKDITSLVKKLDKLWPEFKPASLQAQRDHILALAAGDAEPSAKVKASSKGAKGQSGTTKELEPLTSWSGSMSARPPRG